MRALRTALLALAVVTAAAAQTPDLLLSETRLSVHTLLREDVFAGFRNGNMDRLARAERNIEVLLKERPDQRASLLAWKAGAALYRAVHAHESGQPDGFARHYADATEGFTAAAKADTGSVGVAAIIGGTLVTFGDRLPEAHRAAAWSQAYDNYARLWKLQGADIEKLPVHMKGEVLAGLAQAAQRTGRSAEVPQHLDRMVTILAGTPYEALAKEWKANPSVAATTNLTCKNCHAPGRLAARLEAIKQQ
jgi:hypothetical protein